MLMRLFYQLWLRGSLKLDKQSQKLVSSTNNLFDVIWFDLLSILLKIEIHIIHIRVETLF